jgi:hypothetical protein
MNLGQDAVQIEQSEEKSVHMELERNASEINVTKQCSQPNMLSSLVIWGR